VYARADGTYAGSLDGGKLVKILSDSVSASYAPPVRPGQPGHLLFFRGEALLARPFNVDKLELEGEAIPLTLRGANVFSASANGVLITGRLLSQDSILTWFDRSGRKVQSIGKPFALAGNPAIRLSPNDSQVIIPIEGVNGTDLWIGDLNLDTLSRFTFNGSGSAVWSPDGRKVLWAANDGNRYLRSADGSGKDELLFKNPTCDSCYPNDWSPDGKLIAFSELGQKAVLDLWLVPTEGDRKPYPYLQSHFSPYWAQFSPDNRWMAYGSDQSPQPEQVFVESVPRGKGRWQVTTEGGDWPIWRRDGKELFYLQGTKIMAMPVRLTEASCEFGKPQALFDVGDTGYANGRFQVSRDGQRFLIALPVGTTSTSMRLTVDTDWRAGLTK
jgi:hypothetical protein